MRPRCFAPSGCAPRQGGRRARPALRPSAPSPRWPRVLSEPEAGRPAMRGALIQPSAGALLPDRLDPKCSRPRRNSRTVHRALPRPIAGSCPRRRQVQAWRRALSRRARRPGHRRDLASIPGPARRRLDTDTWHSGQRRYRRIPRSPMARRAARRTGSAAARPSGRWRRAACRDSSSSPGAASGTRTSCRPRTATWERPGCW